MAKRIEPNAQNSEIDPQAHPSGARIENMIMNAENEMPKSKRSASGKQKRNRTVTASEKGAHGETLRPSERENRYVSPEEPAEGGRDQVPDAPHRMDADDREDR